MAYITKKSDKGGSKAKEEYIAKKNIYTKPEYITKKKPEYITKKKPEYITKKDKKAKGGRVGLAYGGRPSGGWTS